MKESINRDFTTTKKVESIMAKIFLVCGLTAVVGVFLISVYMVLSGGPAIAKIGVIDFLLGQVWNPEQSQFGILPMILSSLWATALAILLAVPIGLLSAVFLSYLASKKIGSVFLFAIELLASIPSVVYGLLGAMLIAPMVFGLQEKLGLPQSGSLLAASLVLVIMVLPTIISVSVNAIKSVPKSYYQGSLALGSSPLQAIFKVILPAAKNAIATGVVLGVGRAIGETMAVMMVAGNAPILPGFLEPVRLLTVGISLEWAYSSGLHREALYGIGLVLFAFIMAINLLLSKLIKKGSVTHG